MCLLYTLRNALVFSPVPILLNSKRQMELSTVISSHVLLLKQEIGKFHPMSYYYWCTTNAEVKYHNRELEWLANIYALRIYVSWVLELKISISGVLKLKISIALIHSQGTSMEHVHALCRNHRDGPQIISLCLQLENNHLEHFKLKDGLVYRDTKDAYTCACIFP